MECGKGLACEGGSECNARRWRSPRMWRYGLVKRHGHGSGCCRVVRRVWVKEVAALLRGCWREDDGMEGVSARFKGKYTTRPRRGVVEGLIRNKILLGYRIR